MQSISIDHIGSRTYFIGRKRWVVIVEPETEEGKRFVELRRTSHICKEVVRGIAIRSMYWTEMEMLQGDMSGRGIILM